jgi:hypothetical protein
MIILCRLPNKNQPFLSHSRDLPPPGSIFTGTTGNDIKKSHHLPKENPMMVKTALFETLLESAVDNGDGTWTFTLEGKTYTLTDTLQISRIAQEHDYIIIY